MRKQSRENNRTAKRDDAAAGQRAKQGGGGCFVVVALLTICAVFAVLLLPVHLVNPLTWLFPTDTAEQSSVDEVSNTDAEGSLDNVEGSDDTTEGSASDSTESEGDFSDLEGYYFFDQMSASEKSRYALVYQALSSREIVEYPNRSEEEIGHMRDCVMADHPELFAVESVSWVYQEDEEGCRIRGEFTYTPQETKKYEQQINAAVAECEAGIPEDADDYARARYVYEYLVHTITYDHHAHDNMDSLAVEEQGQTVVDALLEHSCVCAGYSRAFQMIMQDMGYPCAYVQGEIAEDGDSHVWNMVQLDGEWYYVDVTWGDPSYQGDDGQMQEMDEVEYGYLNVTTEDMLRSRTFDSWQELPECTATADNYFVREGMMLDTADTTQVAVWGDDAVLNGDGYFTFRCADQGIYDQVKQEFDVGSIPFPGGTGYTYHYVDDVFVFGVELW